MSSYPVAIVSQLSVMSCTYSPCTQQTYLSHRSVFFLILRRCTIMTSTTTTSFHYFRNWCLWCRCVAYLNIVYTKSYAVVTFRSQNAGLGRNIMIILTENSCNIVAANGQKWRNRRYRLRQWRAPLNRTPRAAFPSVALPPEQPTRKPLRAEPTLSCGGGERRGRRSEFQC